MQAFPRIRWGASITSWKLVMAFKGLVVINARDWGARTLNGHENFQARNVGS